MAHKEAIKFSLNKHGDLCITVKNWALLNTANNQESPFIIKDKKVFIEKLRDEICLHENRNSESGNTALEELIDECAQSVVENTDETITELVDIEA